MGGDEPGRTMTVAAMLQPVARFTAGNDEPARASRALKELLGSEKALLGIGVQEQHVEPGHRIERIAKRGAGKVLVAEVFHVVVLLPPSRVQIRRPRGPRCTEQKVVLRVTNFDGVQVREMAVERCAVVVHVCCSRRRAVPCADHAANDVNFGTCAEEQLCELDRIRPVVRNRGLDVPSHGIDVVFEGKEVLPVLKRHFSTIHAPAGAG